MVLANRCSHTMTAWAVTWTRQLLSSATLTGMAARIASDRFRPMLRISAGLLIMTFAVLILVSAKRTGRVQVGLSPSDLRCRKRDPLAFWIFTLAWSVVALVGSVGCLVLAASTLRPDGVFRVDQRRTWPFVRVDVSIRFYSSC